MGKNNKFFQEEPDQGNITAKRDFCIDITTNMMPQNLEEIEIQIDRLKQRWGEFTYLIGQRLKYIRENRLYQQNNYPDFKTYVTIALKMSENNAYYYISVFEYFTEEQTKKAGSKLKLIIPILNKVKREKEVPEETKQDRINTLRDELFSQIHNKTYREADKILSDMKARYFNHSIPAQEEKKIHIRRDRIIIHEEDPEVQQELIKIIEDFYKKPNVEFKQ